MLMKKPKADAIALYRRLYEQNAPLLRFLQEMGHPLPRLFLSAAELAIGSELREAFEAGEPDLERVKGLLEEAAKFGIPLDEGGLGYALAKSVEGIAAGFRAAPTEISRLQSLDAVVGMGLALPFRVDFWKTQNLYFEMLQSVYPVYLQRSAEGDESAGEWVRRFTALGEKLSIRVTRE